jgi:hypothetical protein
MTAVVIYESMFGNTRKVAEALARGLGQHTTVTVVNVNDAGREFPKADLVLVGAPTHLHGVSSPTTRAEAVRWTKDPSKKLTLESKATGIGIREWLAGLAGSAQGFVAFGTRADIAELVSGSAAKNIQKALTKAGGRAYSQAESFLVHDNELVEGELARAEEIGAKLGARLNADRAPVA